MLCVLRGATAGLPISRSSRRHGENNVSELKVWTSGSTGGCQGWGRAAPPCKPPGSAREKHTHITGLCWGLCFKAGLTQINLTATQCKPILIRGGVRCKAVPTSPQLQPHVNHEALWIVQVVSSSQLPALLRPGQFLALLSLPLLWHYWCSGTSQSFLKYFTDRKSHPVGISWKKPPEQRSGWLRVSSEKTLPGTANPNAIPHDVRD